MDEQLRHCIQQIKSRLPLNNLLTEFGFPPPRSPRRYRSRCLLHQGDNPTSFSADLAHDRWHCFSRSHGGDQITFIKEARRCSFREAVEWAAVRVGIALPTNGRKPSPAAAAMCRLHRRLRDAALAELNAEEASYREIEDGLFALLRSSGQRIHSKLKSEWTGQDYSRDLLIDYYFDELDESVRQRQLRFENTRRQVYAERS